MANTKKAKKTSIEKKKLYELQYVNSKLIGTNCILESIDETLQGIFVMLLTTIIVAFVVLIVFGVKFFASL